MVDRLTHFLVLRLVRFLFGAFIMVSVTAYADQYDDQLHLADSLRVSDTQKSKQLLSQLAENTSELSAYQKDYLTYLNAFHLAIETRLDAAMKVFEELSDRHTNDRLGMRVRSSMLSLYAGTSKWAKGLITANELSEIVQTLEPEGDWYRAQFGLINFYTKLALYDDALFLINSTKPSLENVEDELRCSYIAAEFRALKGLSINNITADWFDKLNQGCFQLPLSLYTIEAVYDWADYLNTTGRFEETVAMINGYKDAYSHLNYFYFVSSIMTKQAEAFLALHQYQKAEQVLDELIQDPRMKGYVQGYAVIARIKAELSVLASDYYEAYRWRQIVAENVQQQNKLAIARELAIQGAQNTQRTIDDSRHLLAKSQSLLEKRLKIARQQVVSGYLFLAIAIAFLFVIVYSLVRLRRQQGELKKHANTDSLTGLDNRRQFMTSMDLVLSNKSDTTIVSLIMFDLDNLKWINDNFGHQSGDWVLKQVGQELLSVEDKRIISRARVGGEEFVIAIANCKADEACAVAELIQKKLNSVDTKPVLGGMAISASYGACDSVQVGRQSSSLLSGADLAMYQAKKQGKGRIIKYIDVI